MKPPVPNIDYVDRLVGSLPLGKGHKLQERAVRAALRSLLLHGNHGVVLADEVGFGKTYEALAIATLLADHAAADGRSFDRVLVLCKPSLVRKWYEEVSSIRAERGFLQYLHGAHWERHPFRNLLVQPHVLDKRASVDALAQQGLRGSKRPDGSIQARRGFYIVNHDLLSESGRDSGRPLLRQLYRTDWDLIIVDEAHHYAKLNRPGLLFAPDEDFRNYDQGIGAGASYILALTATPFELTPTEILNLLCLVRAPAPAIEMIERGLALYVNHLNRFFGLRRRSPDDPLRQKAVETLQSLRDNDATGESATGAGLQELLRRYLIRNTKSDQERRYFFVNKKGAGYELNQFDKLEDLGTRVREAPLIPFDGADALFYLELREIIQETLDRSHEDLQERPTFITNDLRQGLSSYPQIAASALLQRRSLKAQRLQRTVRRWNLPASQRLHPKVRAVVDLVETIARHEVEKINKQPQTWLSKVLVFNKMIAATAPHLRSEISKRLSEVFEEALEKEFARHGIAEKAFRTRLKGAVATVAQRSRRSLAREHGSVAVIPPGLTHKELGRFAGKPLIDAYQDALVRRSQQPLAVLHALTAVGGSVEHLDGWVDEFIVSPVARALNAIAVEHLCRLGTTDRGVEEEVLDLVNRDLENLWDETRSVDLVGRYDGENTQEREAHRRNFNQPFNPFVLLVSRVGEEGIDLQEQCRYIVHYDLEWNPARMEQREGRVDRVGWGRAREGYIDVRFLLLKGTYEERIFHAVMQRDQWFQVLIGAKRRELGADPERTDDASELVDESNLRDVGRLTRKEKTAILLDLRPEGSSDQGVRQTAVAPYP